MKPLSGPQHGHIFAITHPANNAVIGAVGEAAVGAPSTGKVFRDHLATSAHRVQRAYSGDSKVGALSFWRWALPGINSAPL